MNNIERKTIVKVSDNDIIMVTWIFTIIDMLRNYERKGAGEMETAGSTY